MKQMKQEYTSRHAKAEPNPVSQRNQSQRQSSRSQRKNGSPLVFIALLMIILAGLLVFAYAFFSMHHSDNTGALQADVPLATEEPVAYTPAPVETAEPTPVPTTEPEIVLEYASQFQRLSGNGQYLSADVYSGAGFYSASWSVADDGFSYVPEIYFSGADGTVRKLADYKASSGRTNTEGWKNFNSASELKVLTEDAYGNLIALECISTSGFNGPDGMSLGDEGYDQYEQYEKNWVLRILDVSSGTEVSSVEISGETVDSINGSGMRFDGNGNLAVLGDYGVVIVSSTGEAQRYIQCGGYARSVICLNDGRIGILAWKENGLQLAVLDEASTGIAETYELPDSTVMVADGDGDYRFFYSSGLDLYGVSAESGEKEQLFNWTSVDISGGRISSIAADGDNFYCITNDYNEQTESYESCFVSITGVPAGTATQRTELVLVSLNPVDTLQDQVVAYNRSQSQYRIIMKALDSLGDDNDIAAALQQFADEELDGRMPDLIDLTGMPYAEMAGAGMLEDLYPYLDADGELSRSSILSNVLAGLEINGKLYGTSSGFTVSTVIGPSNVLGNAGSWTFDQYYSLTSTMGEGTYAFGANDTQSSVLYDLLGINLKRLISWGDMSCSFETEDFTKILEFIRRLPAEARDTNDSEQIQSGIQLLQRATLYSFEDILYTGTDFKSPTFIGLPTLEGSGNVLNIFKDFAILASSENKQAAWSFVRTSLLTDSQTNQWCFPSNRAAFEAQMAEAQESTEYSEGITADQAALVQSLTENATANSCDETIYSIVLENIQGYLDGRDTAAGAAKYVQDAVTAYLNSL